MSATEDPDLAVTLPRSVWVSLVSSLAQRPYAEVAALIAEIVRQSDEQAEAASPAPAEAPVSIAQRTN